MVKIGTPYRSSSTKLLLLGSGELGKEIAIEAQRLGIEVIACDRYPNAPAMQVAHRAHVLSMLDAEALRKIILMEKPNFIVPEIEAIATQTLLTLEKEGFCIAPSAKAVHLTMNRENIRRLAAEQLNLKTSHYVFAENIHEYQHAIETIGIPCVVKPIMSSSGKGQSIIKNSDDIEEAWKKAQTEGRASGCRVIIEKYIPFDYEITLLTVKHISGTLFCPPIGHLQINGDYRESWQPHPMPEKVLLKAQTMAKKITDELGGHGIFGVEFFIKNDDVYFSEVSPRPHDTGLVTLISQDMSEFALHVRAILGLPVPALRFHGAAASSAIVAHGHGQDIQYHQIEQALQTPDTQIRLFGKPEINGERRVGVILSLADTVTAAREKAKNALDQIKITIDTEASQTHLQSQ